MVYAYQISSEDKKRNGNYSLRKTIGKSVTDASYAYVTL